MADERLGRGLAPQGSAALRQPSPYHYLEFFDAAESLDNEESLISFDDDDSDTSARVPFLSFLLFGTSLIIRSIIIPLRPRIPLAETKLPILPMLVENQSLGSQFPKAFSMAGLILLSGVQLYQLAPMNVSPNRFSRRLVGTIPPSIHTHLLNILHVQASSDRRPYWVVGKNVLNRQRAAHRRL
jgi:hypothetical protein